MNAILTTHTVEKVWGRDILPPPFSNEGAARIGEIWFDPPAQLPELLVKYLFTSERLSVQVHPDDEQAPAGSRGKEECWYILDAEPGAQLAIGLKNALSEGELKAAALDGSIEDLLDYHTVKPGDFFYLPAGTIHAIGPGISLIEIQQNCDITYRLYDYGRPRELHLDAAMEVAKCEPYGHQWHRSLGETGAVSIVEGPHFRLDRVEGRPGDELRSKYAGKCLLIPLAGHFAIGTVEVEPGGCALVEDIDMVDCAEDSRALITQPC
ncbi:class I mannose-6-phosphate isomerase [Parerythrobacter aestuarii]|uniref:class I mannose-6-phosphate isomerase n=1 Tax=Parerythrobacter aestuarii TaxID=3020909 RepID=UPI0024DEE4F6|nr:class I mannose-6-phosphate isomerase [Parerythrobacter aestuarii]